MFNRATKSLSYKSSGLMSNFNKMCNLKSIDTSFKTSFNYTQKYSFSSFYKQQCGSFAGIMKDNVFKVKIMKVPSLGDSISEGTIQTYFKSNENLN
jgi:hypothetical protein